jgi:hypothetical protein
MLSTLPLDYGRGYSCLAMPLVLFLCPVPDNLKASIGIGQKLYGHLAPNF